MNLVTDYAERGPEKSVEIIPGRQKGGRWLVPFWNIPLLPRPHASAWEAGW